MTNTSNSTPPNSPTVSGTFTKFRLKISPTAISYVLYFRNISDEYKKKIWHQKHNLRRKTPEANSKILQHDGRFLRWEESEANTEILQHDATFNLQLARSGAGELHMPSRIASNCKTLVEAQRKLWRLLVSNILPNKHITFVVSIF